jgi:hypothetical protein
VDDRRADDRAKGDERSFRTKNSAERERANRCKGDARGMRDRCRLRVDPAERLVSAVARQERASREDDARARER